MKPTIHFMEQGRQNEQVIFAGDEAEFAQIVKSKGRSAEEDGSLGKRKTLLDEEDGEDLADVKTRAVETNKRYRKFAEMLEKKEKLDDYYLRIDKEKHLLVLACDWQQTNKRKQKKSGTGQTYFKYFRERAR